jgi:membrane protease YdiL (CAAX protease family)
MPELGHRRPLVALLCAGVSLLLLGLTATSGIPLSATSLALAGGLSAAALAGFAMAGAAWSRLTARDALGLRDASDEPGPAARAGLVAGALGLSMLLDVALGWLGAWEGSRLEWIDRLVHGASPGEFVPLFFGLALGPGVAEELLFRGAVLGALARRLGVATGVLGSALLFGAVHMDVAQGGAAAAIGVYLGCVVIVTGNVRTAVIAHVANNTFALLDAALLDPGRQAASVDLVALALGGALVLPALRIVTRHLPRGVRRVEASMRARPSTAHSERL